MFLYIIDVLFLTNEILGKEREHSHQTESSVSMTEPRKIYIIFFFLQPSALIDSQEDLLRTWSGGKVIFCIMVFILINP